jgi:hypothetical protein
MGIPANRLGANRRKRYGNKGDWTEAKVYRANGPVLHQIPPQIDPRVHIFFLPNSLTDISSRSYETDHWRFFMKFGTEDDHHVEVCVY